MVMDEILRMEQLVYHEEEGKQKIYVLPDDEAVEQMLRRLRESGLSDTVKVSLSTKPHRQSESKHDILLDDIASGLPQSTLSMSGKPTVETLFGEYLAADGEQQVYILPDNLKVEELLGGLAGIRTGEIKQSQMWRKTEVGVDHKEHHSWMEEMMTRFELMDQRIKRLESLLD